MTEGALSNKPLLFVYGTLMSHADNEIAQALAGQATKLGDATFCGNMFRLSRPDGSLVYPAVIPSNNASDLVQGEVYQLASPELFQLLDEYEACGPNDPEPHEYERKVVDVHLTNGKTIRAQIYLYSLPTEHLPPIPSGIFEAGT